MYSFYKIENGQAQVGSGTIVPDGFIIYESGKEPVELNEALINEIETNNLKQEISKAKNELSLFDWINSKYVREVQILKTMTSDEYYLKYEQEYTKMRTLVTLINNLELQLV